MLPRCSIDTQLICLDGTSCLHSQLKYSDFCNFHYLASKKCWFFIILKEVLTHFIKSYTLEGNIPSPTINIFGKFPPNTFIPHPTFILLRVNVHPIWLFHTLPLLGTQEYNQFYIVLAVALYSKFDGRCPPNMVIPYPTSIRYSRVPL